MSRIRCVKGSYGITVPFGQVPDYPLNSGFHKGVDYVSNDKTIYAPQNSIVTGLGYDNLNGNYLILETEGFRDFFAHIETGSYLVGKGQVTQGQPLATMGDTGYALGVHSHHGLRVNGVLVDAEQYITEGGNIMDPLNDTDVRQLYQALLYRGATNEEVQLNVGRTWREVFYNLLASAEFLELQPRVQGFLDGEEDEYVETKVYVKKEKK